MPNSDGSPHFISTEHKEKGERIARAVMLAAGEFDQARPRSAQSLAGGLGFSDLGGCREYIRATISGDERRYPKHPLKLPAFVGTWGGEGIERAMAWKFGEAVKTQLQLRLDLGDGIVIQGSSDIIWLGENAVIDLKSKNGIEEVKRDGPSLKEWIQISGYLVACIQGGVLGMDATAHLIYWDRSGANPVAHPATIDYDLALYYLELARGRLNDVAVAFEQGVVGNSWLRDMPESWCFAVGCPFYWQCWDGYTPTNEITDPNLIAAVDAYAEVRDEEKEVAKLKAARREMLKQANGAGDIHYVEGRTPRWIVKWTLVENPSGYVSERLEVRERKDQPLPTTGGEQPPTTPSATGSPSSPAPSTGSDSTRP